MAAAARAAHRTIDRSPVIFSDPLAQALCGAHADALIGYHHAHGAHPVLAGARVCATTRARFTEDRLADAVEHGITQYVVLGAGLDTFAYRSAGSAVRVFEVDLPATQEWKRQTLREAGIAIPDNVVFVPADLAAGSVTERLEAAGFDPSRPAFTAMLGVSMYLTSAALGRILETVGRWAPGSELVMDHLLPEGDRDDAGQAYAAAVQTAAADGGETWRTFLTREEAAGLLERCGLTVLEQAGVRASVDAALWERTDALRPLELPVLTYARLGRERPGPAA
ncbi:SAM-dependent methyltransferase [Streptosporangium fragile]|uniref:S-adenosyl-L-methionine-dependent methyltransferase n=3 Tax=Actinomycetes TaxID=1760 RepID=A0ABN3VY50_9ACTN